MQGDYLLAMRFVKWAIAPSLLAVITVVALSSASAEYTPRQNDKYYDTSVLYSVTEHSATIRERLFRGSLGADAEGGAGADKWRQKSITDEVGGRVRLKLGPGEWVTNPDFSPWYVYAREPQRT